MDPQRSNRRNKKQVQQKTANETKNVAVAHSSKMLPPVTYHLRGCDVEQEFESVEIELTNGKNSSFYHL